MKLSATTGAALTITALSLVFTVGARTAGATEPVDAWVAHCCTAYAEDVPSTSVTPLPTFVATPPSGAPAHVGLTSQLRNLTEANAIAWGWSRGLASDEASAGATRFGGTTARILARGHRHDEAV
jgi:hypothetical protein